jgi:hypothetical protein
MSNTLFRNTQELVLSTLEQGPIRSIGAKTELGITHDELKKVVGRLRRRGFIVREQKLGTDMVYVLEKELFLQL